MARLAAACHTRIYATTSFVRSFLPGTSDGRNPALPKTLGVSAHSSPAPGMARRRRTWNGMRWATTEPFSRLAAWLCQLLHTVLAKLTAQLCSESPALQAAAEECMAAHSPPPLEMAERVLLSPDLMPFILGQLLAEDGTVAAVCSHWLAVWEATKLKQVPLDFPDDAIRTGTQWPINTKSWAWQPLPTAGCR